MLELAPLIKDLAVILGVASIVALLFQKIRQPVVLGYLIAGIIIGPYTPPHAFVSDIPNIQILSELGVIFLMFSLGLDFSFHKLKQAGFSASITGLVEVVSMLGIGMATGFLIGWPFYDSLFLGAALSISSTTIIIKTLEELKLKHTRFAELIVGVLIIEDLLAILLLIGLSMIVLTQQVFSFAIMRAALKLILVVGSWFLAGYFLVPTFLRRIMRYASEETLTIVSVALCLSLVCLAAYFHYSTALGAFIMGSILAETSLVNHIERLVRPVRDIFAAVFFVSVGMLIDPKVIIEHFPLVLLITAVTIIGKLLMTGVSAFLTGQTLTTSLRTGFGMAQVGEFSFIIIALGITLKAVNSSLYPIIVAVSVVTAFTTPYLIRLSGYLAHNLDKHLSESTKDRLDHYATWLSSTFNGSHYVSYGNAIVRLFVNAIIIAIIFLLAEHWISPRINGLFASEYIKKSLCWGIAFILSSPFIWGMLTSFKASFFAMHSVLIRSSFAFLGGLIAAAEITALSLNYFHTWSVTSLLVLFAALFLALLHRPLGKSYRWFESHLMSNLQNKS